MPPENLRDEAFEAAQNKFIKAHGIKPYDSQEPDKANHLLDGRVTTSAQFLGQNVEDTKTPSPAEIARIIEEANNNPIVNEE